MNNKILKISLSALTGLALAATSANAFPSISYSLTAPNSDVSPYTGPYGSVTVSLTDATHATITFAANTVGNGTYSFLFGGAQMADVNLNATSFSVTIDTPSTAKSPPGSGNVSEFGDMNIAIDNKNASDTTDSVVFDVTDLSGSWADVSSVLTPNGDGYVAAAHIIVVDAAGATVKTGYAGNGGRIVPDGASTMALLGTGLLGLGALRRSVGKKN